MSSTEASIASFSNANAAYKYARPTYPDALFDWIASNAPSTKRALDCATGNGQAAQSLALRFNKVDAFDRFQSQIDAAEPADNITYQACEAEATPYEDNSFDAITAAQSIHWFNPERYWAEMARIAKPGALFCAMGYNRFLGAEDIDNLLVEPILDLIDHLWAPNNKLVWHGYDPKALQFPLKPIDMIEYPITLDWSLERYIALMESWSATRKARQDKTLNAQLDKLVAELLKTENPHRMLNLKTNAFVMAGYFE